MRSILLACAGAFLGAVAGRALVELRHRRHGADLPPISPRDLLPGPGDVIPGLIAAARASEPPWSYLHIPRWLAAAGVSFVTTAFSRELQPLFDVATGREPPGDPADAPPEDAEPDAGGSEDSEDPSPPLRYDPASPAPPPRESSTAADVADDERQTGSSTGFRPFGD